MSMKTLSGLLASTLAGLLLAVVIAGGSGCSSTPKPDWNQRIGNFTFDDAVRELGPPVSSTKLQDGGTVAEWFLKYGSTMSFGFGVGSYGGGGGVGVGQTVTTPPKGHYLRLIFGPDGRLQRWEKFTR
jgi:hypothetical protein